jgi:hypothetical protein
MNDSKKNDGRFWKKWGENGAIGSIDSPYNKISIELPDTVNIYDERQSMFKEEYLKNDFEFGKNYLSTKSVFDCPKDKIDKYLSLTKKAGEQL